MSGAKFRELAWKILQPVLIAILVTVLLQIRGLPGEQVEVAGTTHFSNLAVVGDASVGGTLTVTGGHAYTGLVGAYNGLVLTGTITQTSGSNLLAAVVVTGTADLRGVVSSDGGSILRLNENTLITGTLGVSGLSSLAYVKWTAGVSQTVVNTQPITPTGTYQQIAAAVNVYTAAIVTATASAGQLWCLENVGAPTITITDTAAVVNLASTYAMGISDTLTLLYDGYVWVELFRSNN